MHIQIISNFLLVENTSLLGDLNKALILNPKFGDSGFGQRGSFSFPSFKLY